jgi:hypothetical protein
MSQLDPQALVQEAIKSVVKLVGLPSVAVEVEVTVKVDLPGPIDPQVTVFARGEASVGPDGMLKLVPKDLRVE